MKRRLAPATLWWRNSTSHGRSRGWYARRRRVALLRLLSAPDPHTGRGACAECGLSRPHHKLVVDHVDGRTWNIDGLSCWMRVAQHWRDYKNGVRMRALCSSCSSRDGARRRWARRNT